jgi:predicted amidohydrolase
LKVTKELNVALIQANIVWENPAQNRKQFLEKIKSISKPLDLIVLPEMFTTGFTMNASKVAEYMNGDTVLWMQNLAKDKNAALIGSIIITENNHFYNRLLFVHPSGIIETYDKHHTFTLAGEDKVFSAGNKKLIVDYKGWKICPLICYDLRFPVWARNTENYDVLLYVASWPTPRINAWNTLLKARAIENMSYTIGVNRIGTDIHNYEYSGHSVAYDCLGEKLCKSKNKEEVLCITLHKENQENTRNKLGFLNDSDVFQLNP